MSGGFAGGEPVIPLPAEWTRAESARMAVEPWDGGVAKAMYDTLISPNVSDANGEPANLVDALDRIAHAILVLADAVREGRSAGAGAPSSPIAEFNAAIRVSAVLRREYALQEAAPRATVACPAQDGVLSIAADDRRAWCTEPACPVAARPKGADAYALAQFARQRR